MVTFCFCQYVIVPPITNFNVTFQYETFTEEPPWRHFYPEEHDTFTRWPTGRANAMFMTRYFHKVTILMGLG